ncbi:MAG TPA: cytochrome P450 [Hyphomicrobiaceae bacterium]|nr:cytochrome P450 [Hyphomicrobiaceae bacterium]
MFAYRFTVAFLNSPILSRLILGTLRRVRPIAILLGDYYVTSHAHVTEVLSRTADFTVHDALQPGMPWGPFLLTTDWSEVHQRDRNILRSFACNTDPGRIDAIVHESCVKSLQSESLGGEAFRLDFAAEYAEPAVLAVIERYFGVRPLNGRAEDMKQALRLLSSHIMAQAPPDSDIRTRTDEAIAVLTLHIGSEVTQAIERARRGDLKPGPENTVLERMALRFAAGGEPPWFTPDWIRRFLTGLLATAAGTMVRASVHIVDRLLADGEAMTKTRRAATALSADVDLGNRNFPSLAPGTGAQHAFETNSRGIFEQHLLEALRFRPMLPLLVRHCPRDVVLGEGSAFERTIKGGSAVKVGLVSGMFDPAVFRVPGSFLDNSEGLRPGASYLHFGFGPRYCFGTYVARIVTCEIVRLVLQAGTLDRSVGRAGRPIYEAAAVRHLVLTVTPDAGG